MTEGVFTEVGDVLTEQPLPELQPRFARPEAHYARFTAEAGRIGLVWLALAVVYESQNPLTHDAVVAVTLAAFVWLVTLKAASSPDVRLFGRILSETLGVGLGLVGVVLLNDSSLGMHLSWMGIAGAAVGVMATSLAWDWFVDVALAARKRVLFVGSNGLDVIGPEDIHRCRHSGFEIVGTSATEPSTDVGGALVGIEELERVVESQHPDIVVLTDEDTFDEALERLLDTRANVRVASLACFCEYALGRVPIEHIRPGWFVGLVHLRQHVYTRRSKRIFDIVAAGLGLIIASPVLAVLALLAKTTSGPVFHRQTRVGEGGRCFTVLKIRTMRCDAESNGPAFACDDDPRVTRIGRVLRRTHLDELPQLWNVLKGEMSMVGPRPERPEFIEMIEDAVPFWSRRVLVKPGVTGWAQILGDYASDGDGMMRKLSYDLWYLRHGSVLVDVAICVRTVGLTVRGLLGKRATAQEQG